MKAVLVVAVLAALAVHVSAECNNMCSGHGKCTTQDMCLCYRNWRGADCSERTCQFGRSFVDSEQGDLNHDGKVQHASVDLDGNDGADDTGTANTGGFVTVKTQWRAETFELFPPSTVHRALNHVYMECSNKGTCDRDTGECACYEGYEGSSCQRTVCPNSCNGHGVCRNIRDVTQAVAGNKGYTYELWDALKIQACVCDPGYGGVDCSERKCPMGDDPLVPDGGGDLASVVTNADALTGSLDIVFTDEFGEVWTVKVAGADDPTKVAAALLSIPNDVIPSVTVTGDGNTNTMKITFTGNPGDQEDNITIGDVAFTADNSGTVKTNDECSGRGLCDYNTGICDCFRGYRMADCSALSALAY